VGSLPLVCVTARLWLPQKVQGLRRKCRSLLRLTGWRVTTPQEEGDGSESLRQAVDRKRRRTPPGRRDVLTGARGWAAAILPTRISEVDASAEPSRACT
jgi:hypothetical protein